MQNRDFLVFYKNENNSSSKWSTKLKFGQVLENFKSWIATWHFLWFQYFLDMCLSKSLSKFLKNCQVLCLKGKQYWFYSAKYLILGSIFHEKYYIGNYIWGLRNLNCNIFPLRRDIFLSKKVLTLLRVEVSSQCNLQ